jgi:hypothetical protein
MAEKLAEAIGVMSELFAGYRETPIQVETCVACKMDREFCGVSVGKQKGSAGDVCLFESAGTCAGGTVNCMRCCGS